MLIVCKHLDHPIYASIHNNIKSVYNIDTSYGDDIIMSAVPIKYNEDYYIFANLAKLEISSIDLNKKSYEIECIINKDDVLTIPINNVISVHDIKSKVNPKNGDCYYDEHLNIMFIKFQDVRIEYIDITGYNFEGFDKFDKLNNTDVSFTWLNNLFEKKILLSSKTNNKIIFKDDFINLPQIPLLVSETSKIFAESDEIKTIDYPPTGSIVLDETGNLIGMVCYSNKKNIVSIPLFVLKRALEYLNFNSITKINLELLPIKIYLRGDNSKNTLKYGLFYGTSTKKKKDELIDNSYNIIVVIDDLLINSKGHLILETINIPLSAYLWLFKKNNKIKIKSINSKIIKNIKICIFEDNASIDCREVEELIFNKHELKLNTSLNNCLSVSSLNFIKCGGKIMLELNEKIMQMLRPIIQMTDTLDHLYDHVINKKYSSDKVILIIDDRLNIQIVDKINHKPIKYINDVLKIFKTEKNVGIFIKNY